VLPWGPNDCDSSPCLALSRMASGRCRLVIRMDASVFPYSCLWRKPNSPRTLIGVQTVLPHRPDGCIGMLETSWTLKSVRTYCHYIRTDATLNYSKLLYTHGNPDGIATSSGRMLLIDERPDGILGFDFSKFESAQDLPGTCWANIYLNK
jgi:hypothetical protein